MQKAFGYRIGPHGAMLLAAILAVPVAIAAAEAQNMRVSNELLEVRYEKARSSFAIAARPSGRAFVMEGRLQATGGAAKAVEVGHPTFGKCQGIEVAYPDGRRDQILLPEGLPFALFRATLHNGGKEPAVLRSVRTAHIGLDLGMAPESLKVLGTGGLAAAATGPGSYMWMAVAEYAAFDYWGDSPIPPLRGRLSLRVPARSCVVLAVRAVLDRPVLLSTSRHITQGMVDVLEETWDAPRATLAGLSRAVGGDPYELRVWMHSTGGLWKPAAAQVSDADRAAGVTVSMKDQADLLRVMIRSPAGRDVRWQVRFGPPASSRPASSR